MLVPPLGSKEEQRIPLRQIVGPRLRSLDVPQEVKDLVHDVELGRREAPLLKLDNHNMRVVWIEPANIQAWLIYQLGRFSTARVVYVELSAEMRRASQLAGQRFALEQETQLLALLDREPGEPLPEDDPFEDYDEEERPEEDEPDER